MLDVLTYIAIALVVVVVALIVYAASRPDTFSVRRSASIAAPAERIFPLIANLKSMNTWNPFVEPDPAIKIAYSGPEIGKGAAHTWSGNSKVGEGRIEITEAASPSRVAMQLEMRKPMKAHNAVEFTLQPNGGTRQGCPALRFDALGLEPSCSCRARPHCWPSWQW